MKWRDCSVAWREREREEEERGKREKREERLIGQAADVMSFVL